MWVHKALFFLFQCGYSEGYCSTFHNLFPSSQEKPFFAPSGPRDLIPEDKEEEKELPCSPLSFGHNLLRQGTGSADNLTLLRLFAYSRYIMG